VLPKSRRPFENCAHVYARARELDRDRVNWFPLISAWASAVALYSSRIK